MSKKSRSNSRPAAPSLSEEDKALLQRAKEAIKKAQPEGEALKQMYLEDIEKQMDALKDTKIKELDDWKKSEEETFKQQLKEKHNELVQKIEELERHKGDLNTEIDGRKLEAEKLAKENSEAKDKAQKEADGIIAQARDEASKQNAAVLKENEELKKSNENKKQELENKELELEAREESLRITEKRVAKQKEIYEQANPDELEALKQRLKLQSEQIESIQSEYEAAQRELNRIRIAEIHREGISPEELQKTNEDLLKQVEELRNRCERFSEYELSEMQRALKAEPEYNTQINNLRRELSESKTELTRVNNSILEYEQLRSQLALLRTLNENLRSELDNTKRMLESNVGEICPALTSIDVEESTETGLSYIRYKERQTHRNSGRIKKLSDVVDHVRKYAASREKPLFYTEKDMRAFIAGLAASPLAILQGMSGTGKTSLPRIFCDALMGEINIVPVASSWRDRNELLGYYNDFSKKFTAKEFTCDLYRAGCKRYEHAICFIVLDEMNLSRVEYYFADFLSVLEDKKENWKIRLVDTDMRQLPTEISPDVIAELQNDSKEQSRELLDIVNRLYPGCKLSDNNSETISASDKQQLISFLAERQKKTDTPANCRIGGPQNLIDGNTIQIPRNVWFIGTANRDESTFEITDKVYDRAQVLNFNSRAEGQRIDDDCQEVNLTYDELSGMFNQAVSNKNWRLRDEDEVLLQEIEQILKKYFKISYGNRIQDQMNRFVPVYVAAGMSNPNNKPADLIHEAIDYQLTNKVLRKLEHEDELNKEGAGKLRKIFETYDLNQAADFIIWKTAGQEA